MIDRNETVLTGAVAAPSAISFSTELPHNKAYSFQVAWAGSSVSGNAKLQASLDGTNFDDIAESTQSFTGTSGTFLYDVTDANYNWVKIICTSTVGTVTFSVILQMKRESNLG